MIVLMASLSNGIATALSRMPIYGFSSVYQPFLKLLFSPAFIAIASIIWGIISWIVGGIVLFASSKLLKGIGSLDQTLLVVGYSEAPLIYSIIPGLIGKLINSSLLYPLVSMILSIWSSVLIVLGIRETHKFSTLRTIAAILLPIIITFIVILVLVFILLITLLPRIPIF